MTKYNLGQSVRVRANATFSGRPGVYKIVQVLPTEGRGQMYRVKSDSEAFQRTIGESGLDVVE